MLSKILIMIDPYWLHILPACPLIARLIERLLSTCLLMNSLDEAERASCAHAIWCVLFDILYTVTFRVIPILRVSLGR